MSKIQTITLKIEGMTCASCVARVEKVIKKASGVENVSVNLASEKAILSIDAKKYNFEELKKLVEDAGYEVNQPEKELQNKIFLSSKSNEHFVKAKREFFISLIFTIPVFLINMAMMSDDLMSAINFPHQYLNYVLFALTLPIILISGRKFYIKFIKNLRTLTFDMNSLITIGTGSAFIFSSIVTFFPHLLPENLEYHVYYDTTAVIISLVLLGKWIESRTKFRTNSAIDELVNLQPQKVLVKIGNEEIEKGIDELMIDDVVIMKPGQNVPTDGIIINGYSSVDESIVTGESNPIEKIIGSKVISGSINKTGYFEYRVTKSAANSTLGQIIKLIEQSQSSKAPVQKMADKISGIFVPIVITIAIVSLVIWYIISNKVDVALINFISVLIIACPCALGLAIPTALIVGIGGAAKKGILIREAESLELFHKVSTIFFDKTGTLTSKKLKVEDYNTFDIEIEELLEYIIPAEKKSEHPVAEAMVNFSKNFELKTKTLEKFESKSGLGIEAVVDGKQILIGNKNYLIEKFPREISKINEPDNSSSIVIAIIENKLRAIFRISEEIKDEAPQLVKKLSELGVKTFILSGDKQNSTKKIAEKCGVTAFEAELLPEDKLKIIKQFQSKREIVAYIGDGINDAPSITQADVGIAMGSGTDIAILSGSAILLNDNLNNIYHFRKISKKVDKAIKQNLFWAFVYNVIGIPLAAFGLLNPIFAAFAMSMSSVSVITNSLRVKQNL